MKNIQKMINHMNFACAYQELSELNYVFNFNNLTRDFPKINSLKMYVFLTYAISQSEDIEKHISICYYLYFMEPYINGADALIKWHILRVLELSPSNQSVFENWIFGIYNGNPECPFDETELAIYRKKWHGDKDK